MAELAASRRRNVKRYIRAGFDFNDPNYKGPDLPDDRSLWTRDQCKLYTFGKVYRRLQAWKPEFLKWNNIASSGEDSDDDEETKKRKRAAREEFEEGERLAEEVEQEEYEEEDEKGGEEEEEDQRVENENNGRRRSESYSSAEGEDEYEEDEHESNPVSNQGNQCGEPMEM